MLEKGDPLGQIIALARGGSDALTAAQAYELRYFRVGRPKCTWKNGVIHRLFSGLRDVIARPEIDALRATDTFDELIAILPRLAHLEEIRIVTRDLYEWQEDLLVGMLGPRLVMK